MPSKVLITAGVHPEEEAGVLFLQSTDKYSGWHNDMNLSIIPCRNTYGFFITEHVDFERTILACDFGEIYLTNERLLFVPSITYLREQRKQDIMDRLSSAISKMAFEGFLDVLSLRKSSCIHANSFYIHEGKFFDLNCRYKIIDSVFTFSTNNLIKKYNPHYFIDLHESRGTECFLYVSRNNYKAFTLSKEIVETLISKGVPIRDKAIDRERLHLGIFSLESFSDYTYNPSMNPIEIIFETGIDTPLSRRLSWMSFFIDAFFLCIKRKNYD